MHQPTQQLKKQLMQQLVNLEQVGKSSYGHFKKSVKLLFVYFFACELAGKS